MTNLLQCPFCGEDAHIVSEADEFFWVECGGCRATTIQEAESRERAASYWNMRVDNKHQPNKSQE